MKLIPKKSLAFCRKMEYSSPTWAASQGESDMETGKLEKESIITITLTPLQSTTSTNGNQLTTAATIHVEATMLPPTMLDF